MLAWNGPWFALDDDCKVGNNSSYGFDLYSDAKIGVYALPISENYSISLPNESLDLEPGQKRTAY